MTADKQQQAQSQRCVSLKGKELSLVCALSTMQPPDDHPHTCGRKKGLAGPRTVPEPTVHSPAMMRSRLDLQHPEGPITSSDSP